MVCGLYFVKFCNISKLLRFQDMEVQRVADIAAPLPPQRHRCRYSAAIPAEKASDVIFACIFADWRMFTIFAENEKKL